MNTLITDAQEELFKLLSDTEVEIRKHVYYGKYELEDFPLFEKKLDDLLYKFKMEVRENMRGEMAMFYITNCSNKIQEIYTHCIWFLNQKLLNKDDDFTEWMEKATVNRLKNFVTKQIEVATKVTEFVTQNLTSLPNKQTGFSKKYKSDLTLINLAVFWILVTECKMVKLSSYSEIARFVSENFVYKKGNEYVDIDFNNLKSLISKLYNPDTQSETSFKDAQDAIFENLSDQFDLFRNKILKPIGEIKVDNKNSVLSRNKKRLS